MKSIIIKGVILFYNEGTFFIEAKVIDGFVYLLKLFFEGVDVIPVLDFAWDSIPYLIIVPLRLRESLPISLLGLSSSSCFCSSGLMLCLSQYNQLFYLCWSREVIYLMDVFKN